MADREAEKKERELIPCRWLAKEINRTKGTDYEANSSNEEPSDVLLKSASGNHPEIPVQVVSIPLDWRYREDKHSVEKIKRTLTDSLLARGLKHCLVVIVPSGKTETNGMSEAAFNQLDELVYDESRKGDRMLRYEEIEAYSPELAACVHDICITHYEALPGIEVDIPSAAYMLPPDGRWIEEGIRKKVQKYGGPKAVKDLALVIDVAAFVDDDQIDAFRAANPEETLPFSEIWIVAFHGIVCLKRNTS